MSINLTNIKKKIDLFLEQRLYNKKTDFSEARQAKKTKIKFFGRYSRPKFKNY